jgi:hypothetical protein
MPPPPMFLASDTVTVDTRALPAIERARLRWSAVSFEPNWQWERFLDRLPDEDVGITEEHVQRVREFWYAVEQRVDVTLPLPVTQPIASGAIQLAWNRGVYCVEVDVFPDGSFEWFFRDRRKGSIDGSNDRVTGMPKKFVERVRLLARA